MAVTNTLQKKPVQDKTIEIDYNGQKLKLSPSIVKNYLVNGNGNVTDQEVVMFLNLCKFNRLNPFLREAYLIKYGNQPATIVTGKEVFTKRAYRNANFAGQRAGVVVQREDGTLENRIGTIVLEGEKLVGGWAEVHIKGYDTPIEITVSFDEYCLKKDGKPMSNWAAKPATMIRKVALVQALREAFPEDFQGMYSSEEVGVLDMDLPDNVIEVDPATGEVLETEKTIKPEDTAAVDPVDSFFNN